MSSAKGRGFSTNKHTWIAVRFHFEMCTVAEKCVVTNHSRNSKKTLHNLVHDNAL